MSADLQIACAACGYAAELPENETNLPEVVQCPMCGTWIRNYAAEVEAASQPVPLPPPVPDPPQEPSTSTLPDSSSLPTRIDPVSTALGCLVEAGTKTLEEQYPLAGAKTVVGRKDSDINLDDPTMSIHHFEIENRGGEFFIRDLESTNQTQVNGRKITSTTLESGDRIQAGLTMLVFLGG
jgi:hypothetical protein